VIVAEAAAAVGFLSDEADGGGIRPSSSLSSSSVVVVGPRFVVLGSWVCRRRLNRNSNQSLLQQIVRSFIVLIT
jgi:hypothetical protein